MTEVELAAQVVAWLAGRGWTVHQEVEMGRGGPRCDLVAVRGRTVWAIECKTGVGLSVLEQAHQWLRHAHRVSVATRRTRNAFAARVLRDYGVGWLTVGSRVRAVVAPAERRRISDRLIASLADEQRTFAPAGNAAARFWSPWKATVAEVQAWAAAHPAGTFADLVRGIRHHYRTAATARSCLRRHLEEGLVSGVRLTREGGRLVVRLEPELGAGKRRDRGAALRAGVADPGLGPDRDPVVRSVAEAEAGGAGDERVAVVAVGERDRHRADGVDR
jgi:hypothetical protein